MRRQLKTVLAVVSGEYASKTQAFQQASDPGLFRFNSAQTSVKTIDFCLYAPQITLHIGAKLLHIILHIRAQLLHIILYIGAKLLHIILHLGPQLIHVALHLGAQLVDFFPIFFNVIAQPQEYAKYGSKHDNSLRPIAFHSGSSAFSIIIVAYLRQQWQTGRDRVHIACVKTSTRVDSGRSSLLSSTSQSD